MTLASPVSADPYRDKQRRSLFETMETLTHVPWYYLAAIDQYEANVRAVSKDIPPTEGLISIYVPPDKWSGLLNPDQKDQRPVSIQFFQGIGRDANGDGRADSNYDNDILYSLASLVGQKGASEANIRRQLWEYYQHSVAVDIITHTARMFKKYNRLQLEGNAFPLPLQYNYAYRDTWGAGRGWGGRRIHEGTDLFADYGTPVLSTCYGYVELMGWNRYGGWRIGIRDTHNNYHYFAHLNGFRKGLKVGDIVEPGEKIGAVGSSGYGPPGTAGKFPPHLHYGIYKFNGRNTYAFDPYPTLVKWEREAYQKLKQKKQNASMPQSTTDWVD